MTQPELASATSWRLDPHPSVHAVRGLEYYTARVPGGRWDKVIEPHTRATLKVWFTADCIDPAQRVSPYSLETHLELVQAKLALLSSQGPSKPPSKPPTTTTTASPGSDGHAIGLVPMLCLGCVVTVEFREGTFWARLDDHHNQRWTTARGHTVGVALKLLDSRLCAGCAVWASRIVPAEMRMETDDPASPDRQAQ